MYSPENNPCGVVLSVRRDSGGEHGSFARCNISCMHFVRKEHQRCTVQMNHHHAIFGTTMLCFHTTSEQAINLIKGSPRDRRLRRLHPVGPHAAAGVQPGAPRPAAAAARPPRRAARRRHGGVLARVGGPPAARPAIHAGQAGPGCAAAVTVPRCLATTRSCWEGFSTSCSGASAVPHARRFFLLT